MVIDDNILNDLTEQAKGSARLRMHYDLRTSVEDGSQRMLNALEPGTVVPVHRHRGSNESLIVLRGSLRQNFYDNDGGLVESVVLSSGSSCPIVVVPVGVWHNTETLESGTVIFEAKDGKYEPLSAEDIMSDDVVLRARIKRFIEDEARSGSMEVITAEYIYRMWGGKIELERICRVMEEM